jgi:hypothetical protein
MKANFLGICMFATPSSPLEALLPDVRNVPPEHANARPHHALIAVPPNSVNHSGWGPPVVRNIKALGGQTFWTFDLDRVTVTFDPPPGGGPSTINISALPRTIDAVFGSCMDKTELRADIDSVLSARVRIPGGPLQVVPVHIPGAPPDDDILFYTELTVDDDVTIKATDADGTKTLKMVNAATDIYIANIDLVAINEMDGADRALFCVMLEEPQQLVGARAASSNNRVSAYTERTSGGAAASSRKKAVSANKKPRGPSHKGVRLSVITLGPGCSNTQWP